VKSDYFSRFVITLEIETNIKKYFKKIVIGENEEN
tara:strand:+ start:1515 stop:1619 length:105 start_codon:yes stop_codon:yes gene_type:complete